MVKSLTAEERRRIAEKVGVHEATLYQAMTGKGAGFKPSECVRIERESGLELRRWDLRPKDWHENWPELIGAEGAPEIPAAAGAAAAVGREPRERASARQPRRRTPAQSEKPNHRKGR